MMSMNCLLIKSRIATMISVVCAGGLLDGRRGFFRLRFAFAELLLYLRLGNRSRNHRPVGEDERGRCSDVKARSELRRFCDRGRTISLVVGQLAGREILVPRLRPVWRAPDDR